MNLWGTYNKERRLGEFNTHMAHSRQEQQRKTASNIIDAGTRTILRKRCYKKSKYC